MGSFGERGKDKVPHLFRHQMLTYLTSTFPSGPLWATSEWIGNTNASNEQGGEGESRGSAA